MTKDRFSLITVLHDGRVLLDIHLRMLSVEELKRGNGFPDEEILKAIAGSEKSYEEILSFIQGKTDTDSREEE